MNAEKMEETVTDRIIKKLEAHIENNGTVAPFLQSEKDDIRLEILDEVGKLEEENAAHASLLKTYSERMRNLAEENKRLMAALHTIHDHLHHERFNLAHEACESAICGKEVSPERIDMDQAARIQRFAVEFNELAKQMKLMVCWIAFEPSSQDPKMMTMQGGGQVDAIRMLESMLGKAPSTYMGEHQDRDQTAGVTRGGIVLP